MTLSVREAEGRDGERERFLAAVTFNVGRFQTLASSAASHLNLSETLAAQNPCWSIPWESASSESVHTVVTLLWRT